MRLITEWKSKAKNERKKKRKKKRKKESCNTVYEYTYKEELGIELENALTRVVGLCVDGTLIAYFYGTYTNTSLLEVT